MDKHTQLKNYSTDLDKKNFVYARRIKSGEESIYYSQFSRGIFVNNNWADLCQYVMIIACDILNCPFKYNCYLDDFIANIRKVDIGPFVRVSVFATDIYAGKTYFWYFLCELRKCTVHWVNC